MLNVKMNLFHRWKSGTVQLEREWGSVGRCSNEQHENDRHHHHQSVTVPHTQGDTVRLDSSSSQAPSDHRNCDYEVMTVTVTISVTVYLYFTKENSIF